VEIVSRVESRDPSATKECERDASGDAMMHRESSPQFQAHATPVTSETQQAPKLVPDQDSQNGQQEDSICNVEDSPEEQTRSVTAHTPTRSRTPSVLMTPARVSKASISQPCKRLSTKPTRADPVPAPPSEEDLLLVLMHRSRQRGEAVDRLKAKIKTLEHRNFELHVETTSSRQELDDTLAAHTELKQRHTLLQTKLDEFTTRYCKLKAFARSAHQDFVTLRQDAEKQNASIRGLTQVGEEMQASMQDVRTGTQTAQSSLATHIRGLASVRSETQKLVSSAKQLSVDLSSKTDRVMELQRDKGRLEGHILYLEHAKQRASQASRDSSQDVASALTKLESRVDEINCSTLLPPQIAIEQCLALVLALHKKKEVSIEEFEKLSKTVTALGTTVADGVETINASFQCTQNSNASSSHVQIVQELKECLKEMQLSAVHIGQSHIDRARLEERLNASAAMIEQLRKSTTLAESHAATFRKGMDSSIGMSKLQQERLTQVQTQNQEYQIRWNTATSNLASMKRNLMNTEEEVGGEIAILYTLVRDEEHKRRVSEENAILLQQEHERVLEERTRELLCEVWQPNSSLRHY
jgi:hypothetical protein